MGIVDAFSAEEKISMKFSEFHSLVNAAVKGELLVNAVNANVPHMFIRGMLTGKEEHFEEYMVRHTENPCENVGCSTADGTEGAEA